MPGPSNVCIYMSGLPRRKGCRLQQMEEARSWLLRFCCLLVLCNFSSTLLAQLPAPVEEPSHPLSFEVFWDGSVAAQDTDTGEIRWSFSSGPPLSSSHGLLLENTGDSNSSSLITGDPLIADDKYVFCGTDWKLYFYDKRYGMEDLPTSPDELVRSTPAFLDGAIVLGSLSTSAFLVDANSGILVRTFDSRHNSVIVDNDEQENMERLIESNLRESKDANYLFILRKDYTLSSVSTRSGAVLWNVSLGELQLHYVEPDDSVSLPESETNGVHGVLIPTLESDHRGNLLQASDVSSREFIEKQSFKERGTKARVSMSLALPSGDERGNRIANKFVPAIAHEIQDTVSHFDSRRGFMSRGFALGSAAILIVGFLGAASVYQCTKLKQNTKEKPSLSGKRKKGRRPSGQNAKNNVTNKELGAADKAFPERSILGLTDDPLLTISLTNDSRLREMNNMGMRGNVVKDKFDHGEGCFVGSLFITNRIIGYGSHGTVVFEGYLDKRNVAVKRLLLQFYEKAEKELANLIASDEHPNVVRCYAKEVDAHFVYVALERCSFNLNDLIFAQSLQQLGAAKNNVMPANVTDVELQEILSKVGDAKDYTLWDEWARPSVKLLQFMRDILAGLSHLHDLGIVHRDLKPQNVLISSGRISRAKLSDMGISKRLTDNASSLDTQATGLGSSGWQAPEQLLHQRQTRAVDLFSLGCVFFFCISGGYHPFGPRFERDSNILKGEPDLFPVEHIPEAVDLLSILLEMDPMKRPTVKEVLVHPLFWSREKRLSFLRDASDRVELEDRDNHSLLMEDLGASSSVALGCPWDEKLDSVLLENLGRYRRYNYSSVRDLLRVIRNKSNHYRELPQDVQQFVGPIPEGFENYFRNRFPKLLSEVFKVVHKHCRHEDLFQTYFSICTGLE